MVMKNALTEKLGITFPLLMAPMFLVSNEAMMLEAMRSGIAGTFPTLNYREPGSLEGILARLSAARMAQQGGTFGVNLIVQRSNPLYERHLEVCVKAQVPLYITSLGNPDQVVQAAHAYGATVLCDVTNLKHAEKAADTGCDGFIAVGQGAGGHAGPHPLQVLIPVLRERFPNHLILGAGGIAHGSGLLSVLALGADGASVGTRFIASKEAQVSDAYKQAVVDAGLEDIMMTSRLSGTPCSVLATPYARELGSEQNWLERYLSQNPKTKRWVKQLVQYRGFGLLEKSIMPGSYKTLWSAGKSSALIHEVAPCATLVEDFKREYAGAYRALPGPNA